MHEMSLVRSLDDVAALADDEMDGCDLLNVCCCSFLSHDLYLWELGYEYDYLHYQFSFFAFCDETRDEFIEYTNPRSAQAKSYSFYDLRDCMSIASTLQPEHWESSAWAVLSSALMSHLFRRLLKQRCGIEFDQGSFRQFFRPSH